MFINKRYLRIIIVLLILSSTSTKACAQIIKPSKFEPDHNVHPVTKLPSFASESNAKTSNLRKNTFQTIKWLDLMPKKDLNILLNPPDYIMDTIEGTDGDELLDELRSLPKSIQDEYQRALTSMDVITEMDGKSIRIPGFIVPIEFSEEKKIIQFFLVPYFGACIHLPPPPPNQIIFVTYKKGVEVKELFDPVWISGTLQTSHFENDIALSAYSMQMQSLEIYK